MQVKNKRLLVQGLLVALCAIPLSFFLSHLFWEEYYASTEVTYAMVGETLAYFYCIVVALVGGAFFGFVYGRESLNVKLAKWIVSAALLFYYLIDIDMVKETMSLQETFTGGQFKAWTLTIAVLIAWLHVDWQQVVYRVRHEGQPLEVEFRHGWIENIAEQGILLTLAVMTFIAIETLACHSLDSLTPLRIVFSILICYAVFLGGKLLFSGRKIGIVIGAGVLLGLGLINYVVFIFRGTPVSVLDVYALRTAVNVASKFHFVANEYFNQAVLIVLVIALIVLIYTPLKSRLKTKQVLLRGGVYGILACGIILGASQSTWFVEHVYSVVTWNAKIQCQENGLLLNLLCDLQRASVDKPEDYNKKELLAEYTGEAEAEAEIYPNIIFIMNETFADLAVAGEFTTNDDYMPFVHSLAEEDKVQTGYVYVPSFGGGTANSEYEVLTGNSMAFHSGCYPYTQYINHGSYGSLVETLKGQEQSYYTVAMHPFERSSYERMSVYKNIGFDEQMFVDDFQVNKLFRGYVTDHDNYENVIRVVEENQENGPVFVFNVTMQNHGGYGYWGGEQYYEHPVHITSFDAGEAAAEYLSLIRMADTAFQELIEHYEKEDTPTLIVMFGDHFPGMPEEFYAQITGRTEDVEIMDNLDKRATPYVIWANYDLPGLEEDLGNISSNYLGMYILELLGYKQTGFQSYVNALRQQYPIFNSAGAIDTQGNVLNINELKNNQEVKTYEKLQYMYLFDQAGADAVLELP